MKKAALVGILILIAFSVGILLVLGDQEYSLQTSESFETIDNTPEEGQKIELSESMSMGTP